MDRRLDLHDLLVKIINSPNPKETRVYFQPPPSIKLVYPCIVYKRDAKDEKFANDQLYIGTQRYLITVVDPNPDSLIPDKVSKIALTRFAQHYTVDNLNHDSFYTYF